MAAGRLPDASFETTRGAGLQPLHLLIPVMRCGTGYLAAWIMNGMITYAPEFDYH